MTMGCKPAIKSQSKINSGFLFPSKSMRIASAAGSSTICWNLVLDREYSLLNRHQSILTHFAIHQARTGKSAPGNAIAISAGWLGWPWMAGVVLWASLAPPRHCSALFWNERLSFHASIFKLLSNRCSADLDWASHCSRPWTNKQIWKMNADTAHCCAACCQIAKVNIIIWVISTRGIGSPGRDTAVQESVQFIASNVNRGAIS